MAPVLERRSEVRGLKHSEHLSSGRSAVVAVLEEFALVSRMDLESSGPDGRGISDGGSGAAGVGSGRG